jgi:hypothetical protein
MTLLPTELMIARSLAAATKSPENMEIVQQLCMNLDQWFITQGKPRWAVICALTMMTEALRQQSEGEVEALRRGGERDGAN